MSYESETLKEFVSQQDEISRLNNQIDMIANFYRNFYKGEIEKLKSALDCSYSRTHKFKELAGMLEAPKNKVLAMELIRLKWLGVISKTLKEIAKESGYSHNRIRVFSFEFRASSA